MRRLLATVTSFVLTAVSAIICCAAMAVLFTATATIETWQGEE